MLTELQARKLLKLVEDYSAASTSNPDNFFHKSVVRAKKKLYDYVEELTEGDDAGPYLPPTA